MGFIACTDDNQSTNSQGVKLNFNAPGIVARTSASTRATLSTGTTVRVLAYQRVGASSDLSADIYMGENTYVTASDGSLSACVTDDEGKVTSDTGTDMTLRSGTYDFYAVTPALAVTRNSGATVSVDHGKDYATSLTENVSIGTSSTNQSVTLTTLDRKCAQLIFNIDRGAESVTSVIVDELTLSEIATAPLTGSLAADLPAAATNSGTVSLASSAFTADATNAWKASGSVAILPKSSATYGLTLTARFNGNSTARTMSTTVPAIAFEKGMQYTYTLQLYGDKIVLKLSSTSSWETTSWSATTGDGTVTVGSVSNCYIVTPGAGVSIPVSRANESTIAIDGATLTSGTYYQILSTTDWSASLLWETIPGLISIIGNTGTGPSGRFTVFANSPAGDNGGNAVVIVKNSSGTILWSWHIWVTNYNPNTKANGTTYTYNSRVWMDRNLGATSANTVTNSDISSFGLLYQFGRKDPFPGPSALATDDGSYNSLPIYNSSGTLLVENSASTGTGVKKSLVSAAANFSNSVRNPLIFYYSTADLYDWYTNSTSLDDQNTGLWGGSSITSASQKTVYDPCPDGWRVPVWNNGTSPWDGLSTSSGVWNYGWNFSSVPGGYYPAVGQRDALDGNFTLVGSLLWCWSGTVAGDVSYYSSYALGGQEDYLSSPSSGSYYIAKHSRGLSIRCVQE